MCWRNERCSGKDFTTPVLLLPFLFFLVFPPAPLAAGEEGPDGRQPGVERRDGENRRGRRPRGDEEEARRRRAARGRDRGRGEGKARVRKLNEDEKKGDGAEEEAGKKRRKDEEEGRRERMGRGRRGEIEGEEIQEIDIENLPALIQEAIKKGRNNLLVNLPRRPTNFPMGRIALPLAALLRAGVSSDHPEIKAGFETLEQLNLREVYSASCYLMALDALVLAKNREAQRNSTSKTRTVTRRRLQTPAPLQLKMKEIIDWLLRVRNQGRGTWHYRGEGGHDFSNTQFAILGLQVGLEHNIPIPREIFLEISRQFSNQLREATREEFSITYNIQLKSFLTGATNPTKNYQQPIGGWGYTSNERVATPSMTAAGASNLLVARGGLGGSLDRRARESLESALGWMEEVLLLHALQPGEGGRHRGHRRLQRAGLVSRGSAGAPSQPGFRWKLGRLRGHILCSPLPHPGHPPGHAGPPRSPGAHPGRRRKGPEGRPGLRRFHGRVHLGERVFRVPGRHGRCQPSEDRGGGGAQLPPGPSSGDDPLDPAPLE